jgi:RNA polymerase-binding transcription factor DksA
VADHDKTCRALEQRLAVLTQRTSRIEAHLREPGARDSEELATERQNDEVLEGLGDAELQEIEEIRAALTRIADGAYGECATCGESIAEGRLEALPFTPLCIDCASQVG